MASPLSKHELTRVEVLVLIVGCVVLAALLMPAIQSHPTESWVLCSNNVHRITLALQAYHECHRMFPMGAMPAGPSPGGDPPVDATLGPSWWFAILPFADHRMIYDQIVQTQRPGGPKRHAFCADDMNAAGIPLQGLAPDFMRCPRSPLPPFETQSGPVLLPTYVGIAGGCDIDPESSDFPTNNEVLDESGSGAAQDMAPHGGPMRYHNRHKGTAATAGGIVTSSGMLPPCEHVGIHNCTDGTTNTMIVAEQSDWLRDRDADVETKYHGDPGWTASGTGPGGGFLSGTTRADRVPRMRTPGGPPAPWGADCWNITTVRYSLGQKRVLGVAPWPGCSDNHGINNPLQSAHAWSVMVGMVDGSVHQLSLTTDLAVVLRLAIRDDGQQFELPGPRLFEARPTVNK